MHNDPFSRYFLRPKIVHFWTFLDIFGHFFEMSKNRVQPHFKKNPKLCRYIMLSIVICVILTA